MMTESPTRQLSNSARGKSRGSPLSELGTIVSDVWNYRELLFELTLREIRIRYKQAVMGFGWAVLLPMLVVLAGVLVRWALHYLSGNEFDRLSIAGIMLKALPWSFFVGAIGFASASLVGNASLVTKVYFPRNVLPISATLSQAFDTAVASVAIVIVLPLLSVGFTPAVAWSPLLLILLLSLTIALALFLSAANLFFRDVKYIVQVLLTFGIFFTPVFFEPAMFGETGAKIMMLNPLSPILEGLRLSVVEGHNLLEFLYQRPNDGTRLLIWSPWHLLYGAVWALLGLPVAALFFHRVEFLFAEYV